MADPPSYPGTPPWVKISGIIAIALGLTVAILAGTVWAFSLSRAGALSAMVWQDPKFLLTVRGLGYKLAEGDG
jgi:hypothetical protein